MINNIQLELGFNGVKKLVVNISISENSNRRK